MCITITREQRAVLWADLAGDLTAIGDVYGALARGEWAKAQKLRCRFEEDMRLLDDIGWAREDPESKAYEITIAADDLRRTIERLHADAESLVSEQLMETGLDDSMRSVRTHAELLDAIDELPDHAVELAAGA
jgi:hypothetical protein